MSIEFLVLQTVVARLTIPNVTYKKGEKKPKSDFWELSKKLELICLPPRDEVIRFDHRSYYPFYASSDNPVGGCSWTAADEVGGIGQVVLRPVAPSEAHVRVRVGVKLVVEKNDRRASLTVEHDPTAMALGSNFYPNAFIDPTKRRPVASPSSDLAAMDHAFGLGFEFLAAVGKRTLFDDATKRAIARRDMHLVRVQWAAAKPAEDKREVLQLLTVVYDPRIARSSGIVNNATHLGLEFEPRINRKTHYLDGVLFRKFHGNKSVFSVGFHDREAQLYRATSALYGLPEAQSATVQQSLHEVIKVHSEGIVILAKKARGRLESWGEDGAHFFNHLLSPYFFADQEPQPTLWWHMQSIFILSHRRRGRTFERYSFGVWLIPYIETDVLRFNLIAGITAEGFHRLCGMSDPVAVAWRSDKIASSEGWARRLSEIAKVSEPTVYNRRALWRKEVGIDIASPLQLYSDILHFGQASTAEPENITKQLAAVQNEDTETVMRLYAEALTDFEQKRLTILNPALLAPPRGLPLEGPPGIRPDLGDIDLMEEGFDAEMPLESSTSSLSGVADEIDFSEEESTSEPPAKRPSTLANTKPTSPLKAKSKLGSSKLGRKSPKLPGAAPWKLGRQKPFSRS
jgi:hypothetical protein